MFQKGQSVSYGTLGVCKIEGIENINLTGKMSPVLSKEEIEELIKTMPEGETLWIEDDNKRQ